MMEIPDELREYLAAQVAELNKQVARTVGSIIQTGKILASIRVRLAGLGLWEAWLSDVCPLSAATARRYIRVAEMVHGEGVESSELPMTLNALYLLARDDTPADVRAEAFRIAQAGKAVTSDLVHGMLGGVEKAIERQSRLALSPVSQGLQAVIEQWHPAADLFPLLAGIETQLPDIFEEIRLSGVVYDREGEAIRLEDASVGDVERYAGLAHYENGMQAWQEQRDRMLGGGQVAVAGNVPAVLCDSSTVYELRVTRPMVALVWVGNDDLDLVLDELGNKGGDVVLVMAALGGFRVGDIPTWFPDVVDSLWSKRHGR